MLIQPGTYGGSDTLPLLAYDERDTDRAAAGRQLAQLLLPDRDSRALVLALPPGGVVVAGEVARALRLALDVLVVREIVIRPYPALVAGALSESGGLCLNRALFRLPGATLDTFWPEARRATHEIDRLVALFRHGRALPLLQRRSVILVDDGLGAGLMQLAALRALRRMHAARCIVATPYGTPDAIERVAPRADGVVALTIEGANRIAQQQPWQRALDDTIAAALVASYQQGSAAS
jgi:putative phosphoribosyl transferase